MAQRAEIRAAMEAGKSSIDAVGGLYDSALSVYGRFDGAKELKDRHRSLELVVVNGTSNNLKYNDEHFDSGTWFESLKPLVIQPGKAAVAFVANRQGSFMTGVAGGLRFEIEGTGKYLVIGFTNPHMGSYKTSIHVCGSDKPAKYGYDHAEDDSIKFYKEQGFLLAARLSKAKKDAMKLMEYAISK